ncbi:MAG: NAD(P)-dependent oxidoreductase [Armatimonadota bacterium]|nr:NAD(P)-dependent oxidoreductase [Armatimonadota bacterium]
MNVLVTGGTGAVGINIVRALARSGHRVLCLSRRAHDADAAVARFLAAVRHGVTFVPGDVADLDALVTVMRTHRPSHVVHAAAITPTAEMERSSAPEILWANFMGTVHVLEAARRTGVQRLVYISSGAVYGETDEASCIGETFPVRPAGLYAIAKDASERTGVYLAGLHGLEWAALRVGWVYGPMERPMAGSRVTMSLVHTCVRLALAGEEIRLVHLDPVRDWIHAGDVGRAVLAVLTAPALAAQSYNLSGGNGISHRALLETLAHVLPLRYRQVAEAEANVPAALTRPRRGPMSIARLTGDTGFRPAQSLEDGLRDYVDWVRQEARASA